MRVPFRRLLMVGGGAAILATAGFAYLASNTVAPSSAGIGPASISGYNVTGIHYTNEFGLSGSTTASYLNGLSFTLAAQNPETLPPTSVEVYFAQAGAPASPLYYCGQGPTAAEGFSAAYGAPAYPGVCSMMSTGTGTWHLSFAFNMAPGFGPLEVGTSTLVVEAHQ